MLVLGRVQEHGPRRGEAQRGQGALRRPVVLGGRQQHEAVPGREYPFYVMLHGTIEWYDKCCLKVNRTGEPNLLLYKPAIKYMYKEN